MRGGPASTLMIRNCLISLTIRAHGLSALRRIGGRRNQQALLDKSRRLIGAGRLATRWFVRREGTR
jgi:hypothetical protein